MVTEKGRIICNSVVLAGGAWSRLFCGNAGIDLPQLNILASVLRTKPLARAPEITAAGSVFAFRKRLDGGYSIARRNANTVEIATDLFVFCLTSCHSCAPIGTSSASESVSGPGRSSYQTSLVAGRGHAV